MLNKKVFKPLFLFVCFFCSFHQAVAETSKEEEESVLTEQVKQESPYQLLKETERAIHNLSYEISYIFIRRKSIEPIRFRHTKADGKIYAHLTYLSGTPREAIQRGNVVSYFEPNITPFSISNTQIQGLLPAFYSTDVDELTAFYDFISMGNGREAGLKCNLVRLVSKDGNRYSYVLWIDETSKLIARADVLDHSGEVIEQYRALTLVISPQVSQLLLSLDAVKLPAVISPKLNLTNNFTWVPGWLPDGFKLVNNTRHRLINTEEYVESQLYSDGLFNFSVYLSKLQGASLDKHIIRQGKRTLYSEKLGEYEVSLVGDIPPETARHIVKSVRQASVQKRNKND